MIDIKFRGWNKKNHEMVYDDLSIYIYQGNIEINGYVLNQCLGIKDKNGKDMYEDDIVKCDLGNFKIKFGEYDNGQFHKDAVLGFYLERINEGYSFGKIMGLYVNGRYKIIGNIYENPELLKGNNSETI
jgi:uncharacterized phage protein (TIGR01671 family)